MRLCQPFPVRFPSELARRCRPARGRPFLPAAPLDLPGASGGTQSAEVQMYAESVRTSERELCDECPLRLAREA